MEEGMEQPGGLAQRRLPVKYMQDGLAGAGERTNSRTNSAANCETLQTLANFAALRKTT